MAVSLKNCGVLPYEGSYDVQRLSIRLIYKYICQILDYQITNVWSDCFELGLNNL